MLFGTFNKPWWTWLAPPLLAACVAPQPEYVQTPGSQAAFALFEQVREGARSDLTDAARAAELVAAGVCREVGAGRLYCNALRVTEVEFTGTPFGSSLGLRYEELRFCLAPSRAVGFRSYGTDGAVPMPLAREYPEEFALLLRSPRVEVQPDPSFTETTLLFPDQSLTELPLGAAIRRLGYGGPGSRFEQSNSGRYSAGDYPGHAEGERACQRL